MAWAEEGMGRGSEAASPGNLFFAVKKCSAEDGGRRGISERIIKGELREESFAGVRLEWAEGSKKALWRLRDVL